jgi:hypothetical protein
MNELKGNIFSRAKIFLESMNEFAPFGAKLIDGEIKDVVFYNDKNEILNTENAVKIIQENLIEELKDKKIQVGAFAYDVSANFKNADGISEKRDALCLKISTDAENWSEEYFPYMIIDGECVWR